MLKKLLSIFIIVALTLSMSGCTYIGPLIRNKVKEMTADIVDRDSQKESIKTEDENDNGEEDKWNSDIIDNTNESDGFEARLSGDLDPVNELLYKIYTTNYQPSTFAQEDIESDTVQWICSTYALYSEINNKDYHVVGGYPDTKVSELSPNSEHYEKVTEYLKDSNGIENRETAVAVVYYLLSGGINAKYNLEAQEMVANGDMDKDLIKEYKRSPEVFRKLAVQRAYERFGEKGLAGWDLSKVNQVLGDCYYVGYINLEECLDLSLLISKRIQNTFESWDEFYESYLYGQQFLRQDAADNPLTKTANEWETYEQLKSWAKNDHGPFILSFGTELVNNWNQEAQDAKQKAKEKPYKEGVPEKDEDGRITLYTGVEDIPGVKMRVPDGFEMAGVSSPLSVYATRKDNAVSILYNVEINSAFDPIKEKVEEDKKLSLSLIPNDSKIVSDKFEEGKGEVMYYYAIETKSDEMDGVSMIDYRGYKAKKLNDMWIGIHAQLITDTSANVTEKEAVSLMFSDIKFP